MDAHSRTLMELHFEKLCGKLKFRHVDVWDRGRRIMQIEYRVLPWCIDLHDWAQSHLKGRQRYPYTIEIIVNGNHGLHWMGDEIDKYLILPSHGYGDRFRAGRLVSDGVGPGLGDDYEIWNRHCMVTIRVNRDENSRLVSDVVSELIIVPGTDNATSYRRPELALAV